MIKYIAFLPLFISFMFSCGTSKDKNDNTPSNAKIIPAQNPIKKIVKSDAAWKAQLTKMEYYVLREKGTERAFTGDLLNNKSQGIYTCAACSLPLFDSATKFKSGTGWPSYYQAISKENVLEVEDNTLGMRRIEVVCGRCEGHLGHVFDDGPRPTGMRYCINSVALDFVKDTMNVEK